MSDTVKKLNQFRKKTWPFGFMRWLWSVGLALRSKGVLRSDLSPGTCMISLDAESWMVYFMNGLSPAQAVDLDIQEGGEDA